MILRLLFRSFSYSFSFSFSRVGISRHVVSNRAAVEEVLPVRPGPLWHLPWADNIGVGVGIRLLGIRRNAMLLIESISYLDQPAGKAASE